MRKGADAMKRRSLDGSFSDSLGLNRAQTRRLQRFCKRLGMDSEKRVFDERILKLLFKYCWNRKYIQKIRNYLNRIEYTQSSRHYEMQRQQVVEGFCGENHPSFEWNEHFQEVVEEVRAEFRKLNLSEIFYMCDTDIENVLSKLTTHAGWYGLVTTGKIRKGENLDGLLKAFNECVNEAKSTGTLAQPMIIGTRTQNNDILKDDGSFKGKGEKSICKTRTILMVSLLQIVLELKWARPLQNALHDNVWYMGGLDDKQINTLINKYRDRYGYWCSLDYSKFDVTISDWLLRAAYSCYKEAFSKDENFSEDLWNIMVHDAISKRILLADGKLHYSNKGNSSGLQFTSMNASVCNLLAVRTMMKALNINNYKLMIMGDDILIFSSVELELKTVSEYLGKNFGLEMHPHKCSHGTQYQDPEFLSRIWTRDGADRNPVELLAKALYPERWRDYSVIRPEVVLYSYCLSYPLGMRRLIDVNRFLRDEPFMKRELRKLQKGGVSALPHSMAWRATIDKASVSVYIPDYIAA